MGERTVWGIHMGRHHGARPIEEGFVSIGWQRVGDLTSLPADREALKRAIVGDYGDQTWLKPGAVPVYAGVLYRFAHEMLEGDVIVYPSKEDRMVNVGVLGPYAYDPSAADSLEAGDSFETAHRRSVRWKAHVPRAEFPQAALNEIGSALTLFQIANNPEPFLAALAGEQVASDEPSDDEAAEATSEEVEERTEDFVLKRLKTAISDERFEHFVAHLLRCMGYHARVTQKSADGGIDVIAHRDELGFEPPVIKVQCKQKLTSVGRPEVQQLMGAVETAEFGLFVTLGSFTREARDAERGRPNLRLIDGQALCELVFTHYDRFEPQWQTVVPLKQRYIPGPPKGEG